MTELLGTDLHRLLTSRPLDDQFIQYFLYQMLVRRWPFSLVLPFFSARQTLLVLPSVDSSTFTRQASSTVTSSRQTFLSMRIATSRSVFFGGRAHISCISGLTCACFVSFPPLIRRPDLRLWTGPHPGFVRDLYLLFTDAAWRSRFECRPATSSGRRADETPSHVRTDSQMTGYVSTRYYRAPEIMLTWQQYDHAVDIW